MANIGVIGGGSWGTALAAVLARKEAPVGKNKVWLYLRDPEQEKSILQTRENSRYLPGFLLPKNIQPTLSLQEALEGKDFVLFVIPSHGYREVLEQGASFLSPHTRILSATKGIHWETLQFADEILEEFFLRRKGAYLSGPNFAREVMEGLPSATVIASQDQEVAAQFQRLFHTPNFRVYTSGDVRGVLVGGAVKNVIALATGMADGMGLGHNARAALITRGLAEISRLGKALGADPLTFSGLAGMGDLVLTCTGDLSRNRQVGLRLGRGEQLEEILASMNMVAEGIKTARALYSIARKKGVEMPISEQVYHILYHGKEPGKALEELMSRPLKAELL